MGFLLFSHVYTVKECTSLRRRKCSESCLWYGNITMELQEKIDGTKYVICIIVNKYVANRVWYFVLFCAKKSLLKNLKKLVNANILNKQQLSPKEVFV